MYNSAYMEYMDDFDYMALMDVDSVPVFHRSKYRLLPLSRAAPLPLFIYIGPDA